MPMPKGQLRSAHSESNAASFVASSLSKPPQSALSENFNARFFLEANNMTAYRQDYFIQSQTHCSGPPRPALTRAAVTDSKMFCVDTSGRSDDPWSFFQQPPIDQIRNPIDGDRVSQDESKKFLRVTRKARRMARRPLPISSTRTQPSLSETRTIMACNECDKATPAAHSKSSANKEVICRQEDLAANQQESVLSYAPALCSAPSSASAAQAPARETGASVAASAAFCIHDQPASDNAAAPPVPVPGSAFHVPRRPAARLPRSP